MQRRPDEPLLSKVRGEPHIGGRYFFYSYLKKKIGEFVSPHEGFWDRQGLGSFQYIIRIEKEKQTPSHVATKLLFEVGFAGSHVLPISLLNKSGDDGFHGARSETKARDGGDVSSGPRMLSLVLEFLVPQLVTLQGIQVLSKARGLAADKVVSIGWLLEREIQ